MNTPKKVPLKTGSKIQIDPLAVYNVKQASALLLVSDKTILSKIRSGKIHGVGYQPRILGQSLIKYLTE